MKIRHLIPLLATLAALPAAAADRTWDGGDATSNMTAAANWNSNTAINPAADILNFHDGLPLADKTVNNNFAANTPFNSFIFYDEGYTLNGTIMGITNGIACEHPAGTVNINASFTLQNSASFLTATGGNMVFGAGSQTFLNGHQLVLNAKQPGSSIIVGGLMAGGGAISVTDAGSVRFAGAKTFSAPLTIREGGTLVIDNAGGLGTGSGTTTIEDGRLEIDSVAALSIPEVIRMSNTDPVQTYLVSKGGGHTLTGGIEIAGDYFKHFDVEGSSLTMSGAITGDLDFGSILKSGPGRLTLSGSSSNTCDIQIFRVSAGELFLNKSGGATAISSPYLLLGGNTGAPDSAIARLGASQQISDTSYLEIASDGWFDLNGQQETVRKLTFTGPGHLTGNGGTLRVNEGVEAFSATQLGGTASISGAVALGAANSEWDIYGGNIALGLTVNGPVSSLVPGGVLTKTGDGYLSLLGDNTLSKVLCEEGSLVINGNSPGMDVELWNQYLSVRGTVDGLRASGGVITVAGSQVSGSATCSSLDLLGGTHFAFEADTSPPVPGVTHDIIEVNGLVNIGVCYFDVTAHAGNLPAFNPGDEIVVVRNNIASPVTGTFANLPEASIINTGGGALYLSYKGGDGNDITLTSIIPPTGISRLWDGGSAVDDNWMTAANWNPNGVPQAGDDLVFPTSAAQKFNTNNFPAGTTFNSITVHGTGYGLSGNRILLNDKVEFTSASGSHFLSLPITLALDATVSLTGNGFIQATDHFFLNGNKLTLHNSGGGTGDLYISGDITGSGKVHKTGPGEVTFFEQPNSYTGITVVMEGTLAVKADATLGATGNINDTNIAPGATLLIRNNEGSVISGETIVVHDGGTIADNGGTFTAMLNGPVQLLASTATIETTGDQLTINGSIWGPGSLRKTGPGRLSIGGATPNSTGELLIEQGEIVLQKVNAGACLYGARLGQTGLAARLTLAAGNQLPDTAAVRLENPACVFDIGSQQDRIALLTMNGGSITGISPGLLTVDALHTAANAGTATISARLSAPAGLSSVLQVAEGVATPDLSISSIVYGQGFEKTGPGRVDFLANIPSDGLDTLVCKEGSALFFANCRFTDIALIGGLVGGQGTVGNISTISSGTVSPGASPGAFGGSVAIWNPSTNLRMELNGLNPGAEFDQYFANGPLTLGGATLTLTAGFDPAPGSEFMIVRNVSGQPVTGTFVNAPEGGYVSAPGAKVFQITYVGGDGDDVVITRVEVAAPEITAYSVTPGEGENQGSNEVHIGVKGTPGLTYFLESSTDLQNWSFVKSEGADLITGLISFDLIEGENTPRLFYRARLP